MLILALPDHQNPAFRSTSLTGEIWTVEFSGLISKNVADSVSDFGREAQALMVGLNWSPVQIQRVVRNLHAVFFTASIPHPLEERVVAETVRLNGAEELWRTIFVLNEMGLLDSSTEISKEGDFDNWSWFDKKMQSHSPVVRSQLEFWLKSMRGLGTRKRRIRSWERLRSFYYHLRPFIEDQDAMRGTLLNAEVYEVEQFVSEGVRASQGMRSSGLRLLYSALKDEGLIKHNPASSVPARYVRSTPSLTDPEQVSSWFEKSNSPLHKAIVVLVALHALGVREICNIRIRDLSIASKFVDIRKGSKRRRLILDAVSLELITDWLEYRDEAYPGSPNAYLFVSRFSAYAVDGGPMSEPAVGRIVARTGVNARELREDRILFEASVSGDPVSLMRLFGISASASMRYIASAAGRPNHFGL